MKEKIGRAFSHAIDTAVAVALLALILLALLLARDDPFNLGNLKQLAQDILPNLISVPIVYLVVRYFQSVSSEMENEKIAQALTARIVDQLTQDNYQEKAANAIARQLSKKNYLGIVAVHKTLNAETFKAFINKARRQVLILNTWIPDLSSYQEELTEALKRGVPVTILILWPDSDAAELRSKALKNLPNAIPAPNVRSCVWNNLDELRKVARGAGDSRKLLCVKVYNSLPSISVYCVDDNGFVSLFLHDRLAIQLPQFEFEGVHTGFGNHIRQEVKTLERIGIAFDDIENWRDELDAIARKLTETSPDEDLDEDPNEK
jgi:hypothetical protein